MPTTMCGLGDKRSGSARGAAEAENLLRA